MATETTRARNGRRRVKLIDVDQPETNGQADPDAVGARAADAFEAGEDVGGIEPRDLAGSFVSALANSRRVTRESVGLAAELAKVTVGRSAIEPAKGDWRFKDPAWRENFVYRRLGQSYLAAAGALERMV